MNNIGFFFIREMGPCFNQTLEYTAESDHHGGRLHCQYVQKDREGRTLFRASDHVRSQPCDSFPMLFGSEII